MRHETPPGAVCLGSCPPMAAFLMGREHRRSRPMFLRFLCLFVAKWLLNPGVLPADGDRRYLTAKARGEAVCECNFDRLALRKWQREGAAES